MRSLSQVLLTEQSDPIDKYVFNKQQKSVRLKSETPSPYSTSPEKKLKTCSSEIPLSNGKMLLQNGRCTFSKIHLPKIEFPKHQNPYDPKQDIIKWISQSKIPSPPKRKIIFKAIKDSCGYQKRSSLFDFNN